jgi:hypothetical protein
MKSQWEPFKELPPPKDPKDRGRLRLSQGLVDPLAWDIPDQPLDCYGYFRAEGEFICAPENSRLESGSHPFQELIEMAAKIKESTERVSIGEFPRLEELLVVERLVTFRLSWASSARNQLDLNLGVDLVANLGWTRSIENKPIYGAAFGGLLILVSEATRFRARHLQLGASR